MNHFNEWINLILVNSLPDTIVAVNFNIYEDGNSQWSIEFVGTGSFDEDDDDWACDEVFTTRENQLKWISETSWDQVLDMVTDSITEYLSNGMYADKLKAYKGIGVGFVDGDINIIYSRNV